MAKREKFSKFGALMAMAGSAVGLGNLWRFPYLLGENGGFAFILLYLLCSSFVALPIFFCEFIVGRRSGTDCFGAFPLLSNNRKWRYAGLIAVITPLIITSYYSVIGGWSVEYFFRSCCFDFSHIKDRYELSSLFNGFVSSIWPPIIGHTIFLGTTCFIVAKGVKKGIEDFGKIAMPCLFIVVLGMAIFVAFQPGAWQGYEYIFKPDFSKITPDCLSAALGQAFFSLSLGCGCIMIYASYVNKEEKIMYKSIQTALLDTGFAILAACAIMPAVFAYGVDPQAGPSLVYETLPFIFSCMPAGSVMAIFFFAAVLIAALTSSISLCEGVVSYLIEERHMQRKKACILIFFICWIFGCLCSLSFGPLSGIKLFDLSIFEFLDKMTSNFLMTIGALLTVIFVGYVMKKNDVRDEFTSSGRHSNRIFGTAYFMIRYVAPIAIVVIFLTGLIM